MSANSDHSNSSDHEGVAEPPEVPQRPVVRWLRENLLTVAVLGGVVAGVALGFGLRAARSWTEREKMYLGFPGDLFLNMLKGLILPLISASLIAAIGNLDAKLTGKIGCRAVSYYLTTTVLAVFLGIAMVTAIQPGRVGERAAKNDGNKKANVSLPEDSLMDIVRNLLPPNVIEAAMFQYKTEIVAPEGNNQTTDPRIWKTKRTAVQGTNILGVVVVSVVLGVTLGRMKERGKLLLDLFVCLSEAVIRITTVVIWLSPVGILFLVAHAIVGMEDAGVMAGRVGLYLATVLVSLAIQGLVVLPLIYFVLVRKNPYSFLAGMAQALATAFGTASSTATLPVTMRCLEEQNGVDVRVSRFCLPIGATINMDGTALYEAVAAIFIAQVEGVPLTAGSIVAISLTATAASVGAAGIPHAGMATMPMVLGALGLPVDNISLILVVDWLVDRFRTMVNILGDAFGSGVVAHFSQGDLD